MKRLIALILAVVLMVSLAACGKNHVKFFEEKKAIPTPNSLYSFVQFADKNKADGFKGVYRYTQKTSDDESSGVDGADFINVYATFLRYCKALDEDYGFDLYIYDDFVTGNGTDSPRCDVYKGSERVAIIGCAYFSDIDKTSLTILIL